MTNSVQEPDLRFKDLHLSGDRKALTLLRNQRIKELKESGLTNDAIGAIVDLSREGVRQVLSKL